VEVVGFFSTEHKGIFTHHDSFLHMHLISSDEKEMGHLDELEIESMKLYLPKN
jgi:acetolactate decarboxylase